MILKSTLKRGQELRYEKEIMFKGTQTVTAKIIAITNSQVLLDNGDAFHIVNA